MFFSLSPFTQFNQGVGKEKNRGKKEKAKIDKATLMIASFRKAHLSHLWCIRYQNRRQDSLTGANARRESGIASIYFVQSLFMLYWARLE
jgi:hypothetical protein